MEYLRPTWVEIDLGALKDNIRIIRGLIGKSVKLYAVVKGDGYGCGAARIAMAAIEAGVDGFTTGNPEDVLGIRKMGIKAPILLYASTLPEDAARVAELGAIVTIHDFESLHAFSVFKQPVKAFFKLDCGFGRIGFNQNDWSKAFDVARRAKELQIAGLYTHIGNPDDRDLVGNQMQLFSRACELAEEKGLTNLDLIVASSRVLIGYPESYFNAVNPGRLIYGLLEGHWAEKVKLKPVISAIKTRIIQVKELMPGIQIGYEKIKVGERLRTAVIPLGFGDGFPRACGEVIINGFRAPVLGLLGMEQTAIDISGIPNASVGNEVVLLGRQLGEEITYEELSRVTGVQVIELMPRLAKNIERLYING